MTTATTSPKWQQLTGFTPETEANLDADIRDAGIRKLLNEVDRLARIEFARGDSAPAGERTLFWDPLARICNTLGISRTKLSCYSRELTGMRAHELTDRIKAESLPAAMLVILQAQFAAIVDPIREKIDSSSLHVPGYRETITQHIIQLIRAERRGPRNANFAARLGYANPSRLNRACLLAHHETLDGLEEKLSRPMVQKFLNELFAGAKAIAVERLDSRQKTDQPVNDIIFKRIAENMARSGHPPLTSESQQLMADAVARAIIDTQLVPAC
jgi:hypothetical protein